MTVNVELLGGPFDGQVHQFASYLPVIRFAGLADENDEMWVATESPVEESIRQLIYIEYTPTGRRSGRTGYRLYSYVRPK